MLCNDNNLEILNVVAFTKKLQIYRTDTSIEYLISCLIFLAFDLLIVNYQFIPLLASYHQILLQCL